VRQSYDHPSTISRLLSRFRVTWQISTRQRHRRQQKTTDHQDRCIVATSRLNRLMTAPKVANDLHRASGVRISDQSVRNTLVLYINLRAGRPLVAAHLSHRQHQMHVAWATTRVRWTQRQWDTVLFSCGFCRWMHPFLERTFYVTTGGGGGIVS
jgi:hypothetical protein